MTDLEGFSHAELHEALAKVLIDINFHMVEIHVLLTKTEVFNPSYSMDLLEAGTKYMEAATTLVRDSLNTLGVSDEQIDALVTEYLKRFDG